MFNIVIRCFAKLRHQSKREKKIFSFQIVSTYFLPYGFDVISYFKSSKLQTCDRYNYRDLRQPIIQIQWGSKYWTFNYRNYLKPGLKCLGLECFRVPIRILAFENQKNCPLSDWHSKKRTICQTDSFRPFEYRTHTVFRSSLYIQ